MDKTGTLTEGKLKLSDMNTGEAWNGSVQILCTLICAAEEHGASAHPIGAGVFREALKKADGHWEQYKSNVNVKGVREIVGQGVVCQVDLGEKKWHSVCVGSLKLMDENGISGHASLTQEIGFLGTACFVAVNGQLAASLIFQVNPGPKRPKTHRSQKQDTLRPDAKMAIDDLEARGLEIKVMDSGASPSKKLQHIQALQKEGHKVAMVRNARSIVR